ncbi:MAG: CapA family protein [Mesorhizobium sp.]|nr:MAG: CapA family protein [Mesorhizobium sp.]
MAKWTLGGVGDVFVNRDNPQKAFCGSSELLHQLDVVFGNCEGPYTDHPHFAPSAGWRVFASKSNGSALAQAGFDVMALANNHIVDAGHEGLADTLNLLRSQGIKTVGAGSSLEEATAAAIVDHAGIKIGFLSFASVFPAGYEARTGVPGLAPLRAHYFVGTEVNAGGVLPLIRSFPYPEDIERLQSLIDDLRKKVDVVVVSHHWGQCRPAYITEFERIVGHATIDAGADIVFGHHHHFLRGIELYKSKPIFYGLGHFVFDLGGSQYDDGDSYLRKELGEYDIYPREGYPLSPFHPDARMTLVAACDFDGARIKSVGFLPCLINEENHAMPLKVVDPQSRLIADYMVRIGAEAGLPTSYGAISERFGFAYCACTL